jgi:hypothetical protein
MRLKMKVIDDLRTSLTNQRLMYFVFFMNHIHVHETNDFKQNVYDMFLANK